MLDLLKRMVIFGLKILCIAYIFALIEEVITSIIDWIYYTIKGVSPLKRQNNKMENYYREHGVQCLNCKKWYPFTFDFCPLCKKELPILETINKRLEFKNNDDY